MNAGAYQITFDRIGRNRDVAPFNVFVDGESDMARKIRAHARPHIRSRDFDVCIDAEEMTGFIACGMHSGGSFSITPHDD